MRQTKMKATQGRHTYRSVCTLAGFCLTVLASLWPSIAAADCPDPIDESVVFAVRGSGCVLRRTENGSGTYTVACANDSFNLVYERRLSSDHSSVDFKALSTEASVYPHALDVVGLTESGYYRWAASWQASYEGHPYPW